MVENQFRGPDFAERWKIEKTKYEPSVERPASAALAEGEEVKYTEIRASETHIVKKNPQLHIYNLIHEQTCAINILLLRCQKSVTRTPSAFRRKASESRMISATLVQDEADESEEKISIEDDKKSEAKSVSAISLKEMKKPMTEQCKKDILYHLENLIKSVEWLVGVLSNANRIIIHNTTYFQLSSRHY